MCIAIYKPADKSISKQTLQNCFDNNSDGCGFAYINTDRQGVKHLKIKKSLKFDEFWIKYSKATSENGESPFLIHFRIKTHGPINIENCHPFRIDKSHVFIHNGMIKGMTTDKERSDTNRFNIDYLKRLPKGWWGNEGILGMISHMIDYGKIVLMNIEGDVQICNEGKGSWEGGCWYSNTSFQKRTTYTYNNNRITTYKGGVCSGGATSGTNSEKYIGGYFKKTHSSGVTCSGCNIVTFPSIDDEPSFYYDKGEVVNYCPSCAKRILKEFPDILLKDLSMDVYLEYANTPIEVKKDTWNYMLEGKWKNPWDSVDLETGEITEDMEDYIDELYGDREFLPAIIQ